MRNKFNGGDAAVLVGAGLVVTGSYLFDYRLALIAIGLFCLLSGIVRLWYNGERG